MSTSELLSAPIETATTRSLYVAAHPDDIEVMHGHDAMREGNTAFALVATLGRAGLNYNRDPSFCR